MSVSQWHTPVENYEVPISDISGTGSQAIIDTDTSWATVWDSSLKSEFGKLTQYAISNATVGTEFCF